LARFVSGRRADRERSWSRKNRRIPNWAGQKRQVRPALVVALDTSGSVDNTLLAKFLAETKALTELNGMITYLVSCDAQIHDVIEPGERWPEAWGGGGGTDFRPVFELAHTLDIDGIVYFTDGRGSFPDSSSLPTLWALSQSCSVPFGTSIVLA
ncbi:MAG: hypothetical protein KGI66_00695, partial [Patescibacteria group bacterium]|nr:hypothetical protein [Patescibacteria group bacterium]